MKKLLLLAALVLFPIARAQTIELSVGSPFTAQVALSNIMLSDVISLGFAASTERLRFSTSALLDIAPIGSAQASASLEWAYVGRFRVNLAARATLGSATLNAAVAFWNAAPANFDPFEIYAPDPLPNSGTGSRVDLGLGLRASRSVSIFNALRLGSDFSSNSLQIRVRSADTAYSFGVLAASQVGGAVYLLQSGLNVAFEDAGLSFSFGAGIGLSGNTFAYEGNFGIFLGLFEGANLEFALVFQPWRFEVLPFRSSLAFSLKPGFGTLFLTGFVGSNPSSTFAALRLAYRVGWEELFPVPDTRVP